MLCPHLQRWVFSDFADKFIIETDASSMGMGAVLVQKGHPLAFPSKPLSPRQQALSAYERELLAIVFAVKQWRSYLLGQPFVLRTNRLPLKHLLEQHAVSLEQLKWLNKLWGLHYEIEYRRGKENIAADALSRRNDGAVMAITAPTTDLYDRVTQSWARDHQLQQLIADLTQDSTSHRHYSWKDDMLHLKGRLVVGEYRNFHTDLLRFFHADALGGILV